MQSAPLGDPEIFHSAHLRAQKDDGSDAQIGVGRVQVGRGHGPLQGVGGEGSNQRQDYAKHGQAVQRGMQKLAPWPAYRTDIAGEVQACRTAITYNASVSYIRSVKLV